jgi:hypothetical protein
MKSALVVAMLSVALPALAHPSIIVRHHHLVRVDLRHYPAQAESRQGSGYHPAGTVTVGTAAGPITVASDAADKFVSLTNDLVAHGFHGSVSCAATGHMPNSLHHTGHACDFAQTARNRTVGVMYHAAAIIAAHGLRDGCSFGDCGHVDTGTPPAGHRFAAASSRHPAEQEASDARTAARATGRTVLMRWPERGGFTRERFLETGNGTVRAFNLAHHAVARRHVGRM